MRPNLPTTASTPRRASIFHMPLRIALLGFLCSGCYVASDPFTAQVTLANETDMFDFDPPEDIAIVTPSEFATPDTFLEPGDFRRVTVIGDIDDVVVFRAYDVDDNLRAETACDWQDPPGELDRLVTYSGTGDNRLLLCWDFR